METTAHDTFTNRLGRWFARLTGRPALVPARVIVRPDIDPRIRRSAR